MEQKTRVEADRAKVLKMVRVLVRLKHALEADVELNTVLPEVERAFDRAIQAGKAFELDDISKFLGDEL